MISSTKFKPYQMTYINFIPTPEEPVVTYKDGFYFATGNIIVPVNRSVFPDGDNLRALSDKDTRKAISEALEKELCMDTTVETHTLIQLPNKDTLSVHKLEKGWSYFPYKMKYAIPTFFVDTLALYLFMVDTELPRCNRLISNEEQESVKTSKEALLSKSTDWVQKAQEVLKSTQYTDEEKRDKVLNLLN